MVFELLRGGNLEALARKHASPFTESQICSIFYQLLSAIRHMHSMKFLHRDIKPENILLQSCAIGDEIKIKIADLGLAKKLEPSNTRPHTSYVATRWYRSPEILLRIANYSYPSDMWAVGTVMAELIRMGDPLFPGSDEDDQLGRIIALRGHPAMVDWKIGENALRKQRLHLPRVVPSSLKGKIAGASLSVLQLISDLLELDPDKRPTASEALNYPLFLPSISPYENIFQPRKRRKLKSTDLDTARSREYQSTAFTYQSEENREALRGLHSTGSFCEKHTIDLEKGDEGPRYPSFPLAGSSPGLLELTQTENDHGSVVGEKRLLKRLEPAGHFNLRVLR